ncbi:MAG: hypothetical protein P8Y25_15980 [Chromatiaceae bacterium]
MKAVVILLAAGLFMNAISACRSNVEAGKLPGTENDVFSVAGRDMTLVAYNNQCAVLPKGENADQVLLDLEPPCYVLMWSAAPPEADTNFSDGIPVGTVGEVMAWRYPGAGDIVVTAIIGDAVPEHLQGSEDERMLTRRGWHCRGSVQALVVDGLHVRAGTKRAGVGLICAESGMDEKGYWLLAHPTK